MIVFPKRLIEGDLPIRRISEHARHEKSLPSGHIFNLHMWWARRPLVACRAVICAALWPDPADAHCPAAFRDRARDELLKWTSHERQRLLSSASRERFNRVRENPNLFDCNEQLRGAMLDFIADFANWDNSNSPEFLNTSRVLTQAAHEALGGVSGSRPLVVDSFAGGGSIPLEALRVGADAFACDLNPLPVLLNKVILEYIPQYGQRLAEEVRHWGEWIKCKAGQELADFYPKDSDGSTPIAYIWARTVQCEGPGCGAWVPLMRSMWLAKKKERAVALQIVPHRKEKRVDFKIIFRQGGEWVEQSDREPLATTPNFDGTVKRGSATCPCCGYSTPATSVKRQLTARMGGTCDARLVAVVTTNSRVSGRFFRLPNDHDEMAVRRASEKLGQQKRNANHELSPVPEEPLPTTSTGFIAPPLYGMNTFDSLFTQRQLLALTSFSRLLKQAADEMERSLGKHLSVAVETCLALNLSKLADIATSLGSWEPNIPTVQHLFGRQAIPMCWDFAEANPLSEWRGSWHTYHNGMSKVLSEWTGYWHAGRVEQADALNIPLPNDAAQCFITDPPYYNAVPYSDLSDFFYVWLRRSLGDVYPDLFKESLSPKEQEICEMFSWDSVRYPAKDGKWFEAQMGRAMAEGRRVLEPSGIGVVVFAHKSTSGWEAQLSSMIEAGWVITASWPIDTELATRLRGMNSAALASSVHLVCRPRLNADDPARGRECGDWRGILDELPRRIHEWMPRLAEEHIVGADAIFACLGPALEIFSRYGHVEKANGEKVSLKEYLVYVWAAVSKEALAMVFKGGDASGFEEDARLTAMWLWTLSTGENDNSGSMNEEQTLEEDEVAGTAPKGYVLEFDAARKIAQGLGVHLESLSSLIEIKGDTARLLSVAERIRKLLGKDDAHGPATTRKKKAPQLQLGFVAELERAEEDGSWSSKGAPSAGTTVLDRVHQCMILFAAGRGEALRRFLVDEGVGKDERFWRLAQVLSFLYPKTSDEKRWIDGVLARKKGLGL
jgi:putative DNA methylase